MNHSMSVACLCRFRQRTSQWRSILVAFGSLPEDCTKPIANETHQMLKQSQAKKQQKAMHRIVKLQRLVETNDKGLLRVL